MNKREIKLWAYGTAAALLLSDLDGELGLELANDDPESENVKKYNALLEIVHELKRKSKGR